MGSRPAATAATADPLLPSLAARTGVGRRLLDDLAVLIGRRVPLPVGQRHETAIAPMWFRSWCTLQET